jgi:hypothetical protein
MLVMQLQRLFNLTYVLNDELGVSAANQKPVQRNYFPALLILLHGPFKSLCTGDPHYVPYTLLLISLCTGDQHYIP